MEQSINYQQRTASHVPGTHIHFSTSGSLLRKRHCSRRSSTLMQSEGPYTPHSTIQPCGTGRNHVLTGQRYLIAPTTYVRVCPWSYSPGGNLTHLNVCHLGLLNLMLNGLHCRLDTRNEIAMGEVQIELPLPWPGDQPPQLRITQMSRDTTKLNPTTTAAKQIEPLFFKLVGV